ncbi:hypothetical protein LJC20_00485 [Eubacteriales bacterium OttesenSCG-928-M02]|nr:hypothetical protein [Eubacteriales bacterium OttesenSCG-928-M02]
MPTLSDYMTLQGWLDLMSEQTNRAFNAKMDETTNIFMCDYVAIDKGVRELVFIDNNGKTYDVLHIDNPMNMNQHLEIYLKYVGD